MKKFIFAAMAALAITGCSQNEEFEAPGQNDEINFTTVVSKTTRAAIMNTESLKTEGFTVYAYNTKDKDAADGLFTTSIIGGEAVTYKGDAWKIDKTFYWPLTDKVQFYAYATDAKATYVTPTTGYPSVSYVIDPLANAQKDFVVAKTENKVKAGEVGLMFTHALSQVNFSAKGDQDGFTYTVKSIKIAGVASAGTYSFKDGSWETTGEKTAEYIYPINDANKVAAGTTVTVLGVTGNTLMLMPQAMTASAKIQVVYEVHKETALVYTTGDTGIEIPLNATTAWEAGKKVRYTLALANGAVEISFKPEVGDWDTPDTEGGKPVKP